MNIYNFLKKYIKIFKMIIDYWWSQYLLKIRNVTLVVDPEFGCGGI